MYVNDGTGPYPSGVQLCYNSAPTAHATGTVTFNFYE